MIVDSRRLVGDIGYEQCFLAARVICDFGAAAGVVLGGARPRPEALDLPWTGAILHKNGLIEATGLGAAVLGHPALSIAWLANKIAAAGGGLQGADILLAGSFTNPVPAAPGDVLRADYGPLGCVSFQLT